MNGLGEVAELLRRVTVVVGAPGRGIGSGILWSTDGTVVTNAHVVRGTRARIRLWDGRQFDAALQRKDVRRDVAALRIEASGLPAATIADSSRVRPGELAIAIGNPLGFVGALTTGVIHGSGPVRGIGSQIWVLAGVRLAPGNSGGPLADARGQVIGINTMVAGQLALAVPSNAVQDFLLGKAPDSWLGVTVRQVSLPAQAFATREARPALLLLEVEPDGPAAYASLLPGDILLGTTERAFSSVGDLARSLQGVGSRSLRLEFLRGDDRNVRHVTVQLGVSSAARSGIAA